MDAGLDPESAALLESAARADKPIEDMSVQESRAALEAVYAACAPHSWEVGRVLYGVLDALATQPRFRVYFPPGARGTPKGALLFLHGGGWSLGSITAYDPLSRWLCAGADCVVMSLDYSLAPEHKYPVALGEAHAALAWLRDAAPRLGIDPHRIGVAGDSAGGTLATVVALEDRGTGHPPLAAQVLLYPVMSLDPQFQTDSRVRLGGGGYFLTQRGIDIAAERYLSPTDDRRAARISPISSASVEGLPPTLMITAGFDPLRDEGRAYARRLAAAGVPVDDKCYPTTIHAFMSLAGALSIGRQALDETAAWLAARLGGEFTPRA